MSFADHLAHDLFLLLLNLSQLESREVVVRLFTDALESRVGGISLRLADPEEAAGEGALPIATGRRAFGHLVVEGDFAGLPAKTRALIRNALGLLALILERLERDKLLADERLRLEAAVAARTADLVQLNQSLQQAIDQHRQTEGALRRSETRLRTLLESSPDIIAALDRTGTITFLNRAPGRVAHEDMVGTTIYDYLSEEGGEQLRQQLEIAFESPDECVRAFHHTPSSDQWWAIRLVPLSRGGETPSALLIATDITDQRRAEQALERYRSQLEDLVEERTRELDRSRQRLLVSERLASIGTLAAGVAHQINNPLASILAAAEYALLCEDDPNASEVWKRTLQETVEQAKRCGRIVRAILQFSRHEPTEKSCQDVNDIVQRSCQLSHNYAAERGATITFDPCPGDSRVWMSPIEMEQVLVNLLRNAIESRPEDTRVDVWSRRTSKTIRIAVRDDGRGIDAEALKYIFDPFQTTRLREGGTGLGLSVAHGIVVDHRGTISVESEPGQGTTVTIELPLYQGS